MAVGPVTITPRESNRPQTFDKQRADQNFEDQQEELRRDGATDHKVHAGPGSPQASATGALAQPSAPTSESSFGEGMGCEDGFSTRARRGKSYAVGK